MRRLNSITLLVLVASWSVSTQSLSRVSARGGDIVITPLLHASVQVEHAGRVIQVDPWSVADLSEAKPADLILVTDDPGHHLDPAAIAHLRKPGAPVVLTYASDEQKQRLLRPMYTGEEVWCQLFSEPGSGSDVAGLSSRAVRDGDEWIVNGQKVWTTLAHVSRWGMLVARTDPDQPKHKGMTYFLLDMESPGVDVRPLHQITGEAEFNEVFFDDVRIPHDRVFGDVGAGWNAAVTTLMNERVALGGGVPKRGTGPIRDLVQVWDENKETLDPVVRTVLRDRVSALWSEAEALRLTNWRARENSRSGNPGPEGSVGKLMSAEMNQRIYETCMDILGTDALIYEAGYQRKRPDGLRFGDVHPRYSFLRSRATTIEGGTSEIMRNILGERVLGLPGDVRVDKEVPWAEVPRN